MPTDFSLSLKELRLALGLNQDLMAGLLQISRSHLSMAEVGLRPPGAPALLRVHQINQILSGSPGVAAKIESVEPKISDWLEHLRVERFRLKKSLENQQTGGERSSLLLVLLQNMEALQNPDFTPELDQKWKSMVEAAQPEPEEMEWETFRMTVELESLDWKIARLGG